MNAENFHEYLANPSKLHQISYQELKSLVLQYPFSPNLRYLLLLKSMFDQHKDYDRNLALAAMYAPDRKKLWKLVTLHKQLRETKENYELTEDFLELKDLSSLEEIMEKQPIDKVESAAPAAGLTLPDEWPSSEKSVSDSEEDEMFRFPETDKDLDFLEDLFEAHDDAPGGPPAPEPEPVGTTGELADAPDSDTAPPDEKEEALTSLEDLLAEELSGPDDNTPQDVPEGEQPVRIISEAEFLGELPAAGPDWPEGSSDDAAPQLADADDVPDQETHDAPVPLPKAVFQSWKKEIRPLRPGLLASNLKNIASRNPQPLQEEDDDDDYPEAKAQHLARESVKEDPGIASETLALVLEKQGHYEKAIAMYERLILQNPEKKSFFAAKIKSLLEKP